MCVAVPMEVIKIDSQNDTASVALSGNTLDVNISLISPKIGDYVLVHAGCALEIIDRESANEIMELFDTLEELTADEA